MSLEEIYGEITESEETIDAGPLWKAYFEGDEGTISTGALPDSFDPHNFDKVLTTLGYQPGEVRIELVGSTRWEQRTARREWSNTHNAYIRTGEYETVFLNAYRYKATKNAFTVNLPALYAEVKNSYPSRERAVAGKRSVVVCWADIQTGKQDHQGGIKELLERLNEKRDRLDGYLDIINADQIILADVGDIIEGIENTRQQATTNQLSLMDQVDIAATEFWKTARLCEEYAHVDVLSIPSNHCQWRRKKDLIGLPTDDWGLHINKRMERLNEEAGLDISFHRPNDWDETLTFQVRNTAIGLAHGHQASNPDLVRKWWEKMSHGGVLDVDILITGHFHFPSIRPSGRNYRTQRSRWHIQCPTLDNGSAWVRNKMGEDGDPGLIVFAIDDDGFDLSSLAIL